MREWTDALLDARDTARQCASYAKDVDAERFILDDMRHDAVCFCIIVIGEAFNLVPRVLQNRIHAVPWAAVIGMRNRIVHEYWNIDSEIVFRVAAEEATLLADQIEEILESPA